MDFWFQLARWLDSTILDALYGWGSARTGRTPTSIPLIGLNNAFGDMLLNFVLATMFIVLPVLGGCAGLGGRARHRERQFKGLAGPGRQTAGGRVQVSL